MLSSGLFSRPLLPHLASVCGKVSEDQFCRQIGKQDQQGQYKDLVKLRIILKLFDLRGDDHRPRSGDEDDRAHRHHGVDKVITEYFQDGSHGVGRHHPDDGFKPGISHEHGRGLSGSVHLLQRIFDHQVWRREEMNDVTHDDDGQGVL